MGSNKKPLIIFSSFIITPLLLVLLNNYLGESKGLEFSFDNRWMIAELLYFISLLASLHLLKISFTHSYSMWWKAISIVSALIFGFLLYLTYSFSHFGF